MRGWVKVYNCVNEPFQWFGWLKLARMSNKMKIRESSEYYAEGISGGDIRILSQAITLIESKLPSDHQLSSEILESLLDKTGNCIRIGITGIPGVGKSTFIESFGSYLTELGKKIAILAIDPTSKYSGGSIMGDKTRMEKLSVNPNAFIRPSPTGSNLGGVSAYTREAMLLCEAAGFDVILVETVGVGQNELEVRDMVDFFLLLMLSRSGDELQGMKRGIMEIANLIAITKADGDNLEAANQAKAQFNSALHLYTLPASQWQPKVVTCSAFENKGLEDIWQIILEFEKSIKENGYWDKQRQEQQIHWFHTALKRLLYDNFKSTDGVSSRISEMEQKILAKEITPDRAATQVVNSYQQKL